MHKIIIKNLRLQCIIGINPDERTMKQDVIINVALLSDLSKAAASDDIGNTVDYSMLSKDIISFVEGSKFNLIEALAENIADLCLKNRAVEKVEVRVEKPGAIALAESAGIEVTKERS